MADPAPPPPSLSPPAPPAAPALHVDVARTPPLRIVLTPDPASGLVDLAIEEPPGSPPIVRRGLTRAEARLLVANVTRSIEALG